MAKFIACRHFYSVKVHILCTDRLEVPWQSSLSKDKQDDGSD